MTSKASHFYLIAHTLRLWERADSPSQSRSKCLTGSGGAKPSSPRQRARESHRNAQRHGHVSGGSDMHEASLLPAGSIARSNLPALELE